MAAVLASGQAAVLSHTSAAELWGMLRSRRLLPQPMVTKMCTSRPKEAGRRKRHGIVLHRSTTLRPANSPAAMASL